VTSRQKKKKLKGWNRLVISRNEEIRWFVHQMHTKMFLNTEKQPELIVAIAFFFATVTVTRFAIA
jgi:hypothetical protein